MALGCLLQPPHDDASLNIWQEAMVATRSGPERLLKLFNSKDPGTHRGSPHSDVFFVSLSEEQLGWKKNKLLCIIYRHELHVCGGLYTLWGLWMWVCWVGNIVRGSSSLGTRLMVVISVWDNRADYLFLWNAMNIKSG